MVKNPPAKSGDPWSRKTPWRRKWQPTPVFLPGKSHGQWNLVGSSPWGCKTVSHDLITAANQITLCFTMEKNKARKEKGSLSILSVYFEKGKTNV